MKRKSTPVQSTDKTVAMDGPARRGLTGPILVGGEDEPWISGALNLALLLTRTTGLNAHVLGVVRPLGLPMSTLLPSDYEALEEGRRLQHLERVRRRVHQTVGNAAAFSTGAVTGSPAVMLAREARQRGSELILLGLEDKNAPGRTALEDEALQVTRAADVPVLAVPAAAHSLPPRARGARDFSASSLRAARAALVVLDAGATVVLAHVQPAADLESGREGWRDVYARGAAALFEQPKAALSAAGDVTVETELLRGDDPGPALLEFARKGKFDLVASGMQGAWGADRHLTGSVSTALLRGAACTTLIAPSQASG